ncbi:type II toxin-antitoxin system RelE/ParE family toxin [Geomonas sp.]|uniref:type II toxin-antitoxin system RelE/ParE family toxin n=1 Tax=Geomonas sp. TaxID=2651584 RepID=UPI0039C8757B
MPKVIFLPNALRNLDKLRGFLALHDKASAARASRVILNATHALQHYPLLGRPCAGLPEYRDLVVPFGASSYIIRCRIEGETVNIVAVKHAKEAGFSG